MNKWKLKNPVIKISISIGGWDEQSTHFTPMVATDNSRRMFCQSVIDTCRYYNFDGIGNYKTKQKNYERLIFSF
jgi:GH18 family chitinase